MAPKLAPATSSNSQLNALIESKWRQFEVEATRTVGHLEADYLIWKRRATYAGGAIVAGIVLLILFDGDGGDSIMEVLLPATVFSVVAVLFIACLVIGIPTVIWVLWKWHKVHKAFCEALNPLIFKKAFAILGLEATHAVADAEQKKQITALLDHSELITEPHNTVNTDDVIAAQYEGRTLFAAELDAKHVTGSGKNRHTKHIFHGILLMYELSRSLHGKTFVTTDRDRRGYGNMSWWKRLWNKAETPRETLLEWNDFENKLHVATTDETEARYVLTTDFMSELYDWWMERKGNIRISFISNRMYLLFPDKNVKLGSTAASLDAADLKKFVASVAAPLWHALQLLDDVERRFRR